MVTEKHLLIVVVVPPPENLFNSLPEMDVLVLADPLRLHARTLKKNLSRVGVFNPAGEIGMHHRNLPLSENG
jgi:hypothetical protein